MMMKGRRIDDNDERTDFVAADASETRPWKEKID